MELVVDAIRLGKRLTFFQGAGILTAAGIPDFRSPKTGLYANLAKFNLPFPEAVFDIDYFEENPLAFYALAHELYPGNFAPTKFHYFQKLLQDRGQLHRVYTQNIDTLERLAGIDGDLIVEAHGSFATNHCIKCSKEMDNATLKAIIDNHDIPRCSCGRLVKPDITFFGEGLPERFFDLWEEDGDAVEFAMVVGTSLQVHPFASLPEEVSRSVPRVLINNVRVGSFKRKKDAVIVGDIEDVVDKMVRKLGWEEELQKEMGAVKAHETAKEKAIEVAEEVAKAAEEGEQVGEEKVGEKVGEEKEGDQVSENLEKSGEKREKSGAKTQDKTEEGAIAADKPNDADDNTTDDLANEINRLKI